MVLHVVHTELTPAHRTRPQVPPQLSPNTSLHTPLPQLSPHTPILAEAHSRAQTRNNLCVLSHFSHIQLFVTLWAVAHQAPLSMGFSRQEYWSGLPCPPPGDLPHPGTKSGSPALQVDSLLSEPPGKRPPKPKPHRFLTSCFAPPSWTPQQEVRSANSLWSKNYRSICICWGWGQ